MNGVTIELTSVTSPLGKLWLPPPWNHRLGLPPGPLSRGRTRENATFITWATIPAATDESTDVQNVLPRRVSPPSQREPPTMTAMRPYSMTSWLRRAQMPLSSYGTRWSIPARQVGAADSSETAVTSNAAARFRSRAGRAALVVSARIGVHERIRPRRQENRARELKGDLSGTFCARLAAGGAASVADSTRRRVI